MRRFVGARTQTLGNCAAKTCHFSTALLHCAFPLALQWRNSCKLLHRTHTKWPLSWPTTLSNGRPHFNAPRGAPQSRPGARQTAQPIGPKGPSPLLSSGRPQAAKVATGHWLTFGPQAARFGHSSLAKRAQCQVSLCLSPCLQCLARRVENFPLQFGQTLH